MRTSTDQSHTRVSDFSEICVLSSMFRKLVVRFFFDVPWFPHENHRIFEHLRKTRSQSYTDMIWWTLLFDKDSLTDYKTMLRWFKIYTVDVPDNDFWKGSFSGIFGANREVYIPSLRVFCGRDSASDLFLSLHRLKFSHNLGTVPHHLHFFGVWRRRFSRIFCL